MKLWLAGWEAAFLQPCDCFLHVIHYASLDVCWGYGSHPYIPTHSLVIEALLLYPSSANLYHQHFKKLTSVYVCSRRKPTYRNQLICYKTHSWGNLTLKNSISDGEFTVDGGVQSVSRSWKPFSREEPSATSLILTSPLRPGSVCDGGGSRMLRPDQQTKDLFWTPHFQPHLCASGQQLLLCRICVVLSLQCYCSVSQLLLYCM